MNNQEIKNEVNAIKRASKKICSNPETAKELIMSLGMHTKTGKLKKRFK